MAHVLKREVFILITVTSSTKLLVLLTQLEIVVRFFPQGDCVALLVYPYFEFDIEQDKIHKPLLIMQETV